MEFGRFGFEPEHIGTVVAPPVSEVLLNPIEAAAVWQAEAADPEFIHQLAERAVHVETVTEVLNALPVATPLQTAIETGHVTTVQASRLYVSLSKLLENPENTRMALYMPLELLPDASWQPADETLRASANQFVETYRTAWYGLLGAHDVRANFVDGDVLETDLRTGDLPRVVKAAHLMPELYKRGLLSNEEIQAIATHEGDPVLHQSACEALAVMHGFDYEVPSDIAIATPVTERRQAWLADQATEAAIATAARRMQTTLLRRTHVTPPDNPEGQHAFVEGVYGAVTALAQRNLAAATQFFERYEPTFQTLDTLPSTSLRERLDSTLRRLHRLGVVDRTYLEERDIALPDLGKPLSEHLPAMKAEVEHIARLTSLIETDPTLNRVLYPVVALGGSRLKGYGGEQSDTDLSVFIKPNVTVAEREQVRLAIQQTFGAYEPIEFWLEAPAENTLRVRQDSEADAHMAEGNWTHILFNGAWVGSTEAIRTLQQQLLPRYFAAATTPEAATERSHHLERLEQDLLQYRLMHKGYARHYPLHLRDATSYSPAIDGESVFWDPGYRRVALQLFARHVFLPKTTK